MYRQRLRSSKGCIRCKERHRKCDENRPRCSFCARHQVPCIWPTSLQSSSNKDRQLAAVEIRKSNVLYRELTRDRHRPQLDPFHLLPVRDPNSIDIISGQLHCFFAGITQSTLPFDVQEVHSELTRGWLESVYADEAVCSSFVTYCAWFYSERTTRGSELDHLRLKYEARSLALLRQRVETNKAVTDGTILTAVLHFFVATLNVQSVSQLSQIGKGISALVTAAGGPRVAISSLALSTRQSLIFADVFNSLLTTQKPFLDSPLLPTKPISCCFPPISSSIETELADSLGHELVGILQEIRLVLFFREPSQQTRRLSSDESRYLFMLLQKISYGLCNQQNRLAGAQSPAEIAVYAMILVKEEIFLDVIQHPILPITILRRLRSTIAATMTLSQEQNLTISLWASMMALTRAEFEEERTWALGCVIKGLTERYGLSWPRHWSTELRKELQRILWHARIEAVFDKVCTRICHFRDSGSHLIDQYSTAQYNLAEELDST